MSSSQSGQLGHLLDRRRLRPADLVHGHGGGLDRHGSPRVASGRARRGRRCRARPRTRPRRGTACRAAEAPGRSTSAASRSRRGRGRRPTHRQPRAAVPTWNSQASSRFWSGRRLLVDEEERDEPRWLHASVTRPRMITPGALGVGHERADRVRGRRGIDDRRHRRGCVARLLPVRSPIRLRRHLLVGPPCRLDRPGDRRPRPRRTRTPMLEGNMERPPAVGSASPAPRESSPSTASSLSERSGSIADVSIGRERAEDIPVADALAARDLLRLATRRSEEVADDRATATRRESRWASGVKSGSLPIRRSVLPDQRDLSGRVGACVFGPCVLAPVAACCLLACVPRMVQLEEPIEDLGLGARGRPCSALPSRVSWKPWSSSRSLPAVGLRRRPRRARRGDGAAPRCRAFESSGSWTRLYVFVRPSSRRTMSSRRCSSRLASGVADGFASTRAGESLEDVGRRVADVVPQGSRRT